MYKISLTDDDEERISNNLKFEDKVSDKPYQLFFPPKVRDYVADFHEVLEQRAKNPRKAQEPICQAMRTGLRSIAKKICRLDSENCAELNRMLLALIKKGDLSESEKDKARLTFILTFIGDH